MSGGRFAFSPTASGIDMASRLACSAKALAHLSVLTFSFDDTSQ